MNVCLKDGIISSYTTVTVEVSLSPPFYAWVFQFDGKIRILSPEKASEDIKAMAQKYLDY